MGPLCQSVVQVRFVQVRFVHVRFVSGHAFRHAAVPCDEGAFRRCGRRLKFNRRLLRCPRKKQNPPCQRFWRVGFGSALTISNSSAHSFPRTLTAHRNEQAYSYSGDFKAHSSETPSIRRRCINNCRDGTKPTGRLQAKSQMRQRLGVPAPRLDGRGARPSTV
jgi:hypothetical protein